MLELIVVRHGQSQADLEDRYEGRADFELTELGIKQATRAAKWIRDHYKPELIISSTLKRASKTAELIGEYTKVEVQFDEAIMEWNNGLLAGLKREEGMARFPLPPEGRQAHDTFAESESYIAFRARAELFWSQFLFKYGRGDKFKRICLVSHGGMINMLFRSFLKLPMDSDVSIRTGDTGIHLWQVKGQERRILFSNYQEHLRDL